MSDFDENKNGPELTPEPEVTNNNEANTLAPVTLPRKKKPVFLFAIAGVIIGLFLIIIAVLTIPILSNAVALATMSPTKYYSYVEKVNMKDGIDALTKAYGKSMALYNKEDGKTSDLQLAQNSSIKIDLDDDFTSSFGMESIKTIEAKISSSATGEKATSMIELFYGKKTLGTLNYYLDVVEQDMFFQIKELSKNYLFINQDTLSSYTANPSTSEIQAKTQKIITENLLSEKFLNTLLKKYGSLAISEIDDVSLTKKTEINAGDIVSKNTRITVTLDQEDLVTIATILLENAENDEELIKLFEDGEIYTRAEYKSAINLILVALASSTKEVFLEKPIEMIVWVNNKGVIIGREFSVESDGSKVNAGMVQSSKSSKIGYKAWITADDTDSFLLEGTCSRKGSSLSGDMKASFIGDSSADFDITFKDFKVINKEKGYFSGSAGITSDVLNNFSLEVVADAKMTSQNITLRLLNDGAKAITVAMAMEDAKFEDFQLPSKKDSYDFSTDMESYLQNSDMEAFMNNVQGVMDIDALTDYLNLLMGYGFGGSSFDDTSTEDTDINADDDNSSTNANITLPEGVEADESGYYSYEADYDTILAAGVGSSGYEHFNILTSDIINDYQSLLDNTYSSSLVSDEPLMSNTISGSIDKDYPYEYSYFQIQDSWRNPDSYDQYITLSKDSVTDQLISIYVSDSDEKRAKEFVTNLLYLIDKDLNPADKKNILSGFVIRKDKDYEFFNIGDFEISFSKYNDTVSFDIHTTGN